MVIQLTKKIMWLMLFVLGLSSSLAIAHVSIEESVFSDIDISSVNTRISELKAVNLHVAHDQINHEKTGHQVSDNDCHCCFGSCSPSATSSRKYNLFKAAHVFRCILTLSSINCTIPPLLRPPIA